MRPTFRTDLICSREEQQGVVFYRIDDPRTQTSFRLYEIEYLIATKLDGSRSLGQVIAAVKGEFNFDISEPDLQRFVNQLESMGFLHGGRGDTADGSDGQAAQGPVEEDTHVMQRRSERPLEVELLEPSDEEMTDVSRAEYDRLLRSAFLHLKQGYVVHARDYFLAARELSPGDAALAKLIAHLEIVGDVSGPAEVAYLWNEAGQLFPAIAEEVGPIAERVDGPAAQIAEAAERTSAAWDADIRSRVMWTLLLLVVLAAAVGGFIWVVKSSRIFEGAARVRVATLQAERIPVFFASAASAVQPAQKEWLSFGAPGKVAKVAVKPGDRVEAGDVLVSLALPSKIGTQLAAASAAVKRAQAEYDKAAHRLGKALSEREALEAQRNAAEDRLKELRPKSVLGQGGVSKRDMEKAKRDKVTANKKLSQLARKERAPRAIEAKAKKKLAEASAKLESLQKKIGGKLLRAPFAGVVTSVDVQADKPVAAGHKAVLLCDPTAVRLSFDLPNAPALQPGGEVYVAAGRGKPGRGKIASVKTANKVTRVEIRLSDPTGGLLDIAPGQFRLVDEYVDTAFRVPTAAIIEDKRGTHVLIALQKRALLREVQILERDAAGAVIQDRAHSLRDGEQVVVGRAEGGEAASIADGSFLEVEGE